MTISRKEKGSVKRFQNKKATKTGKERRPFSAGIFYTCAECIEVRRKGPGFIEDFPATGRRRIKFSS